MGLAFWTCASSSNMRCRFFQWADPEAARAAAEAADREASGGAAAGSGNSRQLSEPAPLPTAASPGSVEHLVDEATRRRLQVGIGQGGGD